MRSQIIFSGPLVSGLISSLSEACCRDTISWAGHSHRPRQIVEGARRLGRRSVLARFPEFFEGLKPRSYYPERQAVHAFVKRLFRTYLALSAGRILWEFVACQLPRRPSCLSPGTAASLFRRWIIGS